MPEQQCYRYRVVKQDDALMVARGQALWLQILILSYYYSSAFKKQLIDPQLQFIFCGY